MVSARLRAGAIASLLSIAGLAAQAKPTGSAELPEDRATGARSITETRLREWVGRLASPEFAGRGTGTAGFLRAAELVRDHFEALGLEPGGDDGTYWQRVPWERLAADPETSALRILGPDGELTMVPGDGLHGYVATDMAADGEVTLLVGNRGDTRTSSRDLADRIVFAWPRGKASVRFQRSLRRAAAVIWVDDEGATLAPDLAGPSRPGLAAANRAIRGSVLRPNHVLTTTKWFDRLVAWTGRQNDQPILAGAHPLPNTRGTLSIDVVTTPAPAFNVVGILPGSDPDRRDECVVIGSHLDHLGVVGGRAHPGADDDASGTAGVLAVAQALADNEQRPPRSLVFVTFCGEELGLLGSAYFAEHPPVPLSAIVAELQMDMIGRHEEGDRDRPQKNLDTLHLIGTRRLSPELHQLCLDRNQRFAGFDLEWDEENVFERSDHYNFARRGVPIAFFFTGFHPDYHRVTDTPDKIAYDKLGRVARYVYDIAFELARSDDRPHVSERLWRRLRSQERGRAPEQPAAPMRKAK